MADQFEHAQIIEALMRESDLARQAKKAAAEPKLEPSGECLNPACCEPVEAPKLFCNSDCAKEHARRSK